ncbi:RNase A-like domain-containing protein [Baaleninema simplex]|uniref:RNase A-like domain-containing protein n=1 Tax=Baaleninema simplex TaxID=2862350 RepID=UPI0035C93E8C
MDDLETVQPMQSQGRAGNAHNSRRQRRNVESHDAAGGHSIDRYVGRSEHWLCNRLAGDPNLRFASSFRNEAAANRTQGRFVRRYRNEIIDWLNSGRGRPFVAEIEMENPIGIVLERGSSRAVETSTARVVIVRDTSEQGWRIHTSFPIID